MNQAKKKGEEEAKKADGATKKAVARGVEGAKEAARR